MYMKKHIICTYSMLCAKHELHTIVDYTLVIASPQQAKLVEITWNPRGIVTWNTRGNLVGK